MTTERSQSLTAGWQEAYKAHADADESNFLWDKRPHAFVEQVQLIPELKRRRMQLVLDAGCGDGRNSLYLEQCGFYVIGVDLSGAALKLAHRRAISNGSTRVTFFSDDICSMRSAGPVDAILCADCLGQVEDPAQALSEFHRILRPGGVLVANVYDREDGTYGVGEPHPHLPEAFIYKDTLFRFFDEQSVMNLLSSAWQNVSITTSVWFDPPHGDFRPEPHKHSSLVIWAEKPEKADG